jgi:hypothetical protein
LFGPMVVSVWRLVKHCFVVVYWRRCLCLAYAWCHFKRQCAHSPLHPPSCYGGELHPFNGITHFC